MIELKDVFITLRVDDLRYYGPAHTWKNKRPIDPTTKKLDKALVNDQWLTLFPDSVATFQAPQISDHFPCVLKLACPLPYSASRPFKFFNYLTRHPLFLSTVETAWDHSGVESTDLSSFCLKLKSIKRSLKTLEKDNFSHIQKGWLGLTYCFKMSSYRLLTLLLLSPSKLRGIYMENGSSSGVLKSFT